MGKGQDLLQPVLHDQHRVAGLGQRPQRRHEKRRALAVKVCQRFVQKENPLLGCQGGGGDQPLLLPAGEGAGAPLGTQRHPAAGFFDAAADLLRRKGEVLAAKGQLVLHPLVDDLRVGVLQHHTRPAANVAYPLAGYVLAADAHLAGKRPLDHVGDNARQDGQHRAFPLTRIAVQQG